MQGRGVIFVGSRTDCPRTRPPSAPSRLSGDSSPSGRDAAKHHRSDGMDLEPPQPPRACPSTARSKGRRNYRRRKGGHRAEDDEDNQQRTASR